MASKTNKKPVEEIEAHTIASRFVQIAAIAGAVSIVLLAPETSDQLTVRIVAGILAGIGLGARTDDVKEVFIAIFGRGK